MRVSRLEYLKNGGVRVTSEDGSSFYLEPLTAQEAFLSVGDELSDEEVSGLLDVSEEREAKSRALNILSYREHSSGELRRKLMRSVSSRAADAAVERMAELGMINDRDTAFRLAAELSGTRLWGRARVKAALLQRGFSPAVAEEAAGSCPDQRELLRACIHKKRFPLRGNAQDRLRLMRKLAARGFETEDIRAVLSEDFVSEGPEDEDI